jgi:hypothetical protein
MTFEYTPSTTSSQEQGDGHWHSETLDGPTTDPYGQVALHVNLFQPVESNEGEMMSDTSGPTGFDLLTHYDQQRYLESKFLQLLSTVGSMRYVATFDQQTTPAGHLYSRLRLSPNTNETDYSLWPTPQAGTLKNGYSRAGSTDGSRRTLALIGRKIAGHKLKNLLEDWEKPNWLTVEMENKGLLNPAFYRWLMGYPPQWCLAAILASRTLKAAAKKPDWI